MNRRSAAVIVALASATGTIAIACGIDAVGMSPNAEQPVRETGIDVPFIPPPPDAGFDATEDADATADAGPPCPTNLPGPALVPVYPNAGDGGTAAFCIDSTEVTNADYALFLVATDGGTSRAFLDAGVYDGGMPSFCFPHTTFAPKPSSPGSLDEPVSYIDWCDAFAYCQWAGKHLCTTALDGGTNEWRRACTREGTRALPYGNTAEAGACNIGSPANGQKPVKAHPGCEGGYSGLFDMIGNGEEWVDECSAASCETYGGWWGSSVSSDCTATEALSPRYASGGVAFRCCR